MGKPGRKSQWAFVLVLLGCAFLLTGAFFFPGLFTGGGAGHSSRPVSGRGEEAAEPEAVGAKAIEASAAPEAAAPADELPPFGDKNLPLDESIRGRVLDREQKPVADAIVVGRSRDWRTQPAVLVSSGRVRTEADGTFVIGPLERQAYAVVAEKEGVGVAYVSNVQVGAWIDLTLAPGARLEGTVTSRETRQPVAGAKVFVHEWTYRAETKTDEQGAYVFTALPQSASAWQGFTVAAVADGLRRGERTNFAPKAGAKYRIDFALDKGSTLAGRVVDKGQRPLAGATVAEGIEIFHRSVTTGADGSYALPNVDIAPNLVYVARSDGYLSQQRQSDGTGALDFELEASLGLEGIVTDRRDVPLKGARVYLHRLQFAAGIQPDQGMQVNQGQNVTTSASDGRFRFDGVLPGQVAVVAFHRDTGPGEKTPIDLPVGGPSPKDVRVRLSEGLTIEGEVRDKDSKPLASVTVQAQGWEQVPGFQFVSMYRWQENPVTCTDSEGRFRLRGALPGKQWLNAYHVSLGWAGQQVEGSEGQRLTDVKISFAGGAIEGRVLGAEREPLVRARVQARGPKNTPQMTRRQVETDGLGRFRLGGLPDGTYDIYANPPMGGSAEPALDVPVGRTDVEIVLKPTQTLSGEVRSSITGRAIERFYLSIQPEQDPAADAAAGGRPQPRTSWANWLRAPDGRFEMSVMAGRYKVIVKAPGHQPRVLDRVVVEELVPPNPLDIVLDAGGGIEGTLRDPDGKPVPNGYVQVRPFRGTGAMEESDWILGGNDQTDDRGRFFLEGLGAGTYILQTNMGPRGAATARVSVAGSEMVRHDLALLPTGTLVLKVVDEEGKPVPNVYFYLYDDEGNWIGWGGMSDQNGEARSEQVRAGPAIVKAYHQSQEYVAEDTRAQILPGRIATLDLKMKKK